VGGDRLAKRFLGARRVADVAVQTECLAGAERSRGIGDPGRVDVEQRDASALLDQHARRGEAKARGCAGDDRGACVDLHDSFPSLGRLRPTS
jgi:hypothetical protein